VLCAGGGGRAVRVYRLGAEYDWPAIEAALHENFARWGPRYYDWQCNPHHTAKEPQRTAVRHTGRYKCRGLSNARKPTGLWQMYMYYCYRLGIYPRQKPTVNWPEIRAQWRDTDRLCRELDFVTRHRFKSVDAISDYRAAIAGRAKAMRAERTECTRQLRHRNCHPSQINTLEARRAELTGTLKELRREDALAAAVIWRLEKEKNYSLKKNKMPLCTITQVCQYVGNGIVKLMERAVPSGKDNPVFEQALSDFKEYYAEHCHDKTALYPGVLALLQNLKKKGVKMAVVSNKADFAVKELMPVYFPNLLDVALGEMEEMGIRKKPAPDMVYKALAELRCDKKNAVYIGDSDVDLATAKASEMDCIGVSWGFRGRTFLEEHGADYIVDKPEEIEKFFK